MLRKILLVMMGALLVMSLAIPAFAQENEEKENEEILVNLDYVETDIRAVVQDISFNTGIQIVVGQNVEGYVSVGPMENIPFEKALDLICASGGFAYVKVQDYYVILVLDPDNPVFQMYSDKDWVKLNYVNAKDIPNILKSYSPYLQADEATNRVIITALPGKMMTKIKQDIKAIDVPVLKKVEIRLVSLEYSKQKKSEINLDSLKAFLGNGLERKGIYGIQIGSQLFGASSEDELRSLLKLKILADTGEMRITGDQRATVLEGQTAKIFRDREGDIFISPKQDDYYSFQKETIQAGQGVEVKVLGVTSSNEILLNVQGRLEDIKEVPEITRSGQAIWVDRRCVNTTLTVENYQTISIGTLSRKVAEKKKGILSSYTGEKEIETLFLLTANVVGTEKPEELEIDKKAEEFFVKAERPEKIKRLALGVGSWFSSDGDSLLVYDGQLILSKDTKLKLFGGGGQKEERYVGYAGLKYGDMLNIGVGGINANNLPETELFLSFGLSFGTDTVRLESDYFYIPDNVDESGARVLLKIRF